MTCKEFNQKWSKHLEEGFDGLVIELDEVVEFCDEQFTRMVDAYPHFTYSQIKLKFGSARVYLDGDVSTGWIDVLEEGIERILWERESYK